MRRNAITLLVMLVALITLPTTARAKDCSSDGSTKVCVAILKESCSPGPPYRCRTARDRQHYRDGKFDYSQYQARRRTCKGFGGTRCRLDYKTYCTTTRVSKRCRTDTATVCKGGSTSRCRRTVDSCVTGKSFRCRFTKVEERCSDRVCRTTRLICNTSPQRGKRCFSRFSSGPGRMAANASEDQADANAPFFEGDGSEPSDPATSASG